MSTTSPLQNPARAELIEILSSLVPPPNFKVVLDVDPMTENLKLKVLKRIPKKYLFFGKCVWTSIPDWSNPSCAQRELTARTYETLLSMLKERPDFLEFELTFEGKLDFQTVCNL